MNSQDVVVIGGGVMGCSIAFRLAQAGMKVTVLERSIPGAEASSAAAGMLAPQKEANAPGPLLDLCLRSRGMYRAFVQELEELSGIQVDYLASGILDLALDVSAAQALHATVAWQKAAGLRAELLTGDNARSLEPSLSSRVLAAAHFPDDHQVDNRKLVRALSMAAARVGTTFRTGYVREVVSCQDRVTGVDIDGELLAAEQVVIAAGSWSGLIQGAALSPKLIRPVRGQMVQFQTRLPMLNRILSCPRGYLVPRADGRLIAGSTAEFAGFDKQVTAEGLSKILSMALELCPGLASAQVTETWAGLRPYAEDRLPILGAGPVPGLLLATGHFRNGILLAPITARLLTELAQRQAPSFDLQPFRFNRFLPS